VSGLELSEFEGFCEERVGTAPPQARTQVIYDLECLAISRYGPHSLGFGLSEVGCGFSVLGVRIQGLGFRVWTGVILDMLIRCCGWCFRVKSLELGV